MNKFKRKKLIEKFYEKVMDLTVYLDAPNSPFGPRGDGAKQCFCVEAHHLFDEIKKDLDKLEDDLLERYGYDKESIEYVDYD